MKQLIENNYKSIQSRGLITTFTTKEEFLNKLIEEVREVQEAIDFNSNDELKEEIADVILTALNFARHYGFDIEEELKRKIEINFKRALN